MNRFFASLFLTLLVAAVVLTVVLAVTLGFVGIGWVVNRVFALGLLQSTALAVVVGFSVVTIAYRIFSLPDFGLAEEWGEWDEEDEEE